MVKYFTEVRKTSEDVEVCPLLTCCFNTTNM